MGDVSEMVSRIFDYWKLVLNHPRAQLDDKRSAAIRKILKAGYTEDDCMLSIEGCADSSFHQGDNKDGKVYDALGLIFRDADHMDRFMEGGAALRRRVEKQAEAALRKAACPPPAEERKGMPDNVRQRVREILKQRSETPKDHQPKE